MLLALAEVLGSAAPISQAAPASSLRTLLARGAAGVGEAPENSPGLHRRPVPLGQGQGRRGEGVEASVCGSPRPLPQSPSSGTLLAAPQFANVWGFHPLASRKRGG